MASNQKTTILDAELQDLSRELQEIAVGKEGHFYKYREPAAIGANIQAELLKKYEAGNGAFPFSDDLPEHGILSQTQGLASLCSVIENLIGKKSKESTAAIDSLIDDLLARTKGKNGGYRIDASPYMNGAAVFDEYMYMDSVTWLVSAVLGVVRLHIKGLYNLDSESERGRALIDLYRFCIKTINESFIDGTTTKRKFNLGWNFTAGCEEPSLYFTFAVSELLIDILGTFENVIRNADVTLIQQLIVETLDKNKLLSSERYLHRKDRIEAMLKSADEDKSTEGYEGVLDSFYEFSESERLLITEVYQKCRFIESQCGDQVNKINSNSEEVKREQKYFELLNEDCQPYDEASPYRLFEANCKRSAEQIWDLTKEGLASGFFSSDLSTTVSEEAIESSVSSDAVFNVIFAINTIINAGLDEDSEDKINYFTINGSEDYLTVLSEYDNMRDTLRMAYDNCYQYMMRLKKENKDYKINEFVLNFDESFVKHADLARTMRRARIRVFSLMPLMVRTKTTIGEFLIQYPQYDMILYLEQMLKYRCWDSEQQEYQWIWENDGYSTSSNYYFVSAFAAFYDYYKEYEENCIKNANNNQKKKKEIEEKYLAALREKGKAVDLDVREFEEQNEKIAALEAEITGLKENIAAYENDPLRSALTGFVKTILSQAIVDVLADELSREAGRILSTTKDRVLQKAEEYKADNGTDTVPLDGWPRTKKEGFEKGMSDLLLALMAEPLGQTLYSMKPTGEEREKALDGIDRTKRKMEGDLQQALRYYLQGLAVDRPSYFVTNRGESTLIPADNQLLEGLIKQARSKKGDND